MNSFPETMTVERALAKHSCLTVSDTAHLDCQLLLASILNQSRTWLFGHSDYQLNTDQRRDYESLLKSRSSGKPIAYLTGFQEFWSMEFKVSEATLIPRPDTELLVETILNRYPETATVIDLGTGAGAIAISLAVERPGFSLFATDRCHASIEIARSNSRQLACDSIHFVQCDWLRSFSESQFDIIVCNPPYVEPDDEHLAALTYEPRSALVAGEKGLTAITKIAATASRCLKPGGMLLLEHGYNQQTAVRHLMEINHFNRIEPLSDLSGQPRAVLAYSS